MVVDHGDILHVMPPSWRHDIDGPADLVEEVVRIHGLTDVPSVALAATSAVAKPVLTTAQRRTRTARRTLAARGFNECVSFSFIARDQAKLFGGGDEARQLSNPIASDLDALRPSLLPSLLAAAARNAARGFADLQLFEIGAAFDSGMPEAQTTIAAGHPHRRPERATGSKSGHAADACSTPRPTCWRRWKRSPARRCPRRSPKARPAGIIPAAAAPSRMGPKVIAQFGELHPKILAAFDLKVPAAGFEIFLDAIPDAKTKGKAQPLFPPSPYPGDRARLRLCGGCAKWRRAISSRRVQAGRPHPDRQRRRVRRL